MNVDSGQNNQPLIDKQPEKAANVNPQSNPNNQPQKTKAQTAPATVPIEKKVDAKPISQTTNQVAQNLPPQNPATQDLPSLTAEITPKSFSGAGSAFAPPKTQSSTAGPTQSTAPTTNITDEPKSAKTKPKKLKKTGSKKKAPLFLLIGFIILLLGGAGVFYTIQKQREAEVPTAPVSEPEAAIETWCTLQFTVEEPNLCPEDATLSIDEPNSNPGNTYIIATSSIDYNNVALRLVDTAGNLIVFTPASGGTGVDPNSGESTTTWTFETELSENEISSAIFYVETDPQDVENTGEPCGTFTPDAPEPLACGETGCSDTQPCVDVLTCIPVATSNVCSKITTTEYDYEAICATADPSDSEALVAACCTMPMCVEDADITLAVADDESAIITVTAPYPYTDIEIRVDDGDDDTANFFGSPITTQVGEDYVWTWELEAINAYNVESIAFYIDVDPDFLGESGEVCGIYSPDITPTPTPVPGECGAEGCEADTDCDGDLICIEADDGDNYCSMEEYETACADEPSVATCCTAPTAAPTPTPTDEPGATNTPPPGATNTPPPGSTSTPIPTGPITVDTTIDCNDACTDNSDCTNISHICYNGLCRLDVNPEDEYCRTPAGETVVERIVEAPISGPGDWLNYLKIGIGAIGAGLLMLLFL